MGGDLMKKFDNEIYSRVDEKFLSDFKPKHLDFMENIYYNYYFKLCKEYKRKPLEKQKFFTNMHRQRFQLYQFCCPYCESVFIMWRDKTIDKHDGFNYCPNCGRGSIVCNIQNQIYRFIRISNVNRLGLHTLKEKFPEKDDWILGFDSYQMELVELASIIEILFRDYFLALCFINNMGVSNKYFKKAIANDTKNDFMNIEKANNQFKKAFHINIKQLITESEWNSCIDIVNLRNMIVHNNEMLDERFKSTQSFVRLKDKIIGNIIKIDEQDIQKYLTNVVYAVTKISNAFLEKYNLLRNVVIANYYFNLENNS